MGDDKAQCGVCHMTQDDDNGGEMWISCTHCKQWFHKDCVGLEVLPPENDPWLCSACDKLRLSEINHTNNDDDDDDDDETEQLALMTSMIKEREELLMLKQKQLDLMEKRSQRNKADNVEGWLKSSSKFGESSKSVKGNVGAISKVNNANNISSNVTIRKSRDVKNNSQPTRTNRKAKDRVDDKSNGDLSALMRRQMQLMSQQYLSDLPEFDGDADVWPIFYHQFISTTEQGGFDDSFNLIRLRKCLKGEARQAVAGIMSMPNCLQDVMTILEKRFGSHDVIVKKKMKKLSSLIPPNENKAQTVKHFYEFLLGFIATLKSANALNYLQSPQTLDVVVDKLSPSLKRQWIRFVRSMDDQPTIDEFVDWFEPIYDCAIECDTEIQKSEQPKRSSAHVNMNKEQSKESEVSSTAMKDNIERKCSFCGKAYHSLLECEKFKKVSIGKKWFFVRKRRLCFGCLVSRHRYENCDKKEMCNIEGCQEYHHKSLHSTKMSKSSNDHETNSQETEAQLTAKSCCGTNKTLFRSLPVVLSNPLNGKKVVTWAFLDEGSSPTMLLNTIADELELDGEQDELCTTWTDQSIRKETNSRRVKVMISGVDQNKRVFTLNNVRTVSQLNLPLPIPTQTLKTKYEHLRDVEIPDVPVVCPTILIGLEHAKLGLMYEVREGKWNEPVATKTRLGWVVHGKDDHHNPENFVCHVCECDKSEELSSLMREFYTTETFGVKLVDKLLEAKDSIRAKFVLESTTKRINNEYETGLLWRRDDITLPESRRMAERRLLCFEKKLERDEKLKSAVITKMYEHIDKGYLVRLSPESFVNKRHWYLPVFAVQNPNKPFKPRLVFDAAAKSNGVSLNDMLLKGPDMISSLFGIILRFRQRKIAISADIAEMFHRVKIIEQDQLCQLVLWRDCDESRPIEIYKMTRMTFGATCSPSSAHYVKDINAMQHKNSYPRAVEAIIQNHYVDNLLDSFDSEEEALEVSRKIHSIHSEAGFNIRCWVSNSKVVEKEMNLQAGSDRVEVNMNVLQESEMEKILGMYWMINEDVFVFKVNVNRVNQEMIRKLKLPTKREILRVVMSQFDPLGVLSPLIIHAKILMQEIWVTGIDWDDKIPIHLQSKWNDWLDALNEVPNLKISRCYFQCPDNLKEKITLHLFADASEQAFACVGFLHVSYGIDVGVSFVAAKSRVAPQKSLSIPRLELQAAVLSTRLKDAITTEISIPIDEIVFWTDSKTVLGWIRSTTRKYSAFVSHRISEILDSTTICQWRWLPTHQNVADEATRMTDTPLVSQRWINGPAFLYESREKWPQEVEKTITTDEEKKSVEEFHCIQEINKPFIEVNRFSKWERLLRCAAFIGRFANKLLKYLQRNGGCKRDSTKKQQTKMSVPEIIRTVPALNGDELEFGERILYSIAQRDHYSAEIRAFSNNEKISRSSSIFNLNPVLDEDGILRLAGRLEASPVIVNEKLRKPIILPREHHITCLLIDAVHRKFHHVNKECVVNEIRQFVWIPKIRVQINKIANGCFYCKNRLAKPRIPKMAQLPIARLSPHQPAFSFTGIDFFGPMEITVGRHHEKRWGVLFVCLTMRAIHLELAASLDTNSAIMCVRNFMCRRGAPLEIFSDNGTNLRAAEKELKKAVQEIDFIRLQERAGKHLPNETRTRWSFIPPSAPHFGGSWERMIQTVKKSLYIVLREKFPKEETLRNALIEIEHLVNSRPLYYSANNIDNNEAITPNHLLQISNRQAVPLPGEFDCRKQWRVAQSLATEFWGRWLREYLPTISRRKKWFSEVNNLQIGNIVLIIDDNLKRGEWKRGIITQVCPSQDGKVRTVEVRTAYGTYIRPVAKLAVIDLEEAM